MKEKRKEQKGITLIALIITIIVLLILAVVSVKVIVDGGIITHAQNAAHDYEQAQNNELQQLNEAENYIAQHANGSNKGKLWTLIEVKSKNAENVREGIYIVGSATTEKQLVIAPYFKDPYSEDEMINAMIGYIYINETTGENKMYFMWLEDYNLASQYEEPVIAKANQWYEVTGGDLTQNQKLASIPDSLLNIPTNEILDQEIYQEIINFKY